MHSFNYKADNLLQLQPEDDAAYIRFNNPANIKFHIPSREQFTELVEYTIKKEIWRFNGVPGLCGLLFTSRINRNSIFFPGTGYYDRAELDEKNLVTLWTSTLSGNPHYAAYFYGNSTAPFASNTRFCGMPIRPVVTLKN